jgi:putative transposase
MPGPKPTPVALTKEAQRRLRILVMGHNTRQQIAKRARMILLAAEGKDNSAIGREVGVSRLTVKQWRERWLTLEPIPLKELSAEERVEDLPRPGGPARITADQRCQLEALACESPEKSGRPISQWTGREIADEMMARNIVETISPRHAARLLKRCINSSSPDSLLVEHREG